jgi:glutamate dehydrogenase
MTRTPASIEGAIRPAVHLPVQAFPPVHLPESPPHPSAAPPGVPNGGGWITLPPLSPAATIKINRLMSTTTTLQTPAAADAVTVDELCDHLGAQPRPDGGLLCDFARLFFARVPRQLLQERSVRELGAMTVGAWEFLRRARPDQVNVEVVDPRDEGWKAPVTVLRAEVGDRPFIVDSIREYLAGEGIHILHYIYPVLSVRRDGDGNITAVGDARAEGGELEALGHVEIAHVARPERRAGIAGQVQARLRDVVEATRDFRAMEAAVDRVAARVAGYAQRFAEHRQEYGEIVDFLRWLKDGNFIFLGHRAYDLVGSGEDVRIAVEPGTGLGILSEEERSAYHEPRPVSELPEEFRARVVGGPLLMVSKANREATVHRRARMDYVGVKKLDEAGRVVGEWRFLGLFTTQAHAQSPAEIPILRHRLQHILDAASARPGSHDYKEIVSIVQSMPKDELFQASPDDLKGEVGTVLANLFTDEVRVTVRPDPLRGGVSVMVLLPRGRFSGEARQRVTDLLQRRFGGTLLSAHTAFGEGDQARLHFFFSTPGGIPAADAAEIEREVVRLIRSWEDRLRDALTGAAEVDADVLARAWGDAFSPEYKAANTPAAAVHDVLRLEAMNAGGTAETVQLRNPASEEEGVPGTTSLKLYLREDRLILSDFMPILEDHGVRVIEVDTFAVAGSGSPRYTIYSFAVQTREGEAIPEERHGILAETLLASRSGDAQHDAYNALVLAAGLRWREVDVLRTYANYAAQIGAVPTRLAPVRALLAYPGVARRLIELFTARFLPGKKPVKAELQALRADLAGDLEKVSSLADDRALRRLMGLIEGTVRTSYFRRGAADPGEGDRSGGVPYISIKVRNADVEELKKSRLLYEVYVHSSRMEGVHLRGAPVSRGGIRWSDRPDDFRTEILGLVLTQVVKNATIVPSGSKGGFITKRQYPDRDAQMAEAAEQYKTLMRGLLDVTDNLVDGKVVPPPSVVRQDGDDPYLVVAADKGTAHLSDTANGVAAEYGFWLDDAFASGGSQGYDHKEEGITARGGWECVKRHFREMGKDIQTTPFTVAGIGDMSGDVFGNGMLLSEQIRLIAAFDHRHVFIDPDPDPARSFAERRRMYTLPRSSWADYDPAVMSPGAMLVPRATKEVELTPQARKALGVADDVERLDGEGLVKAVLRAPVELLWNGGIGTYVKDREETHADVGDTTNDPVRINADELRCKVVGEGGNLGFTQRGRVAFALRGGRLNTDALDNSAGVDMSDHEVNLKILLSPVVRSGELTEEGRNQLLAAMTDEVSRLVLKNNIGQSLAVSLDEIRSREALDDFTALVTALERDRRIDRAAEGIPDAEGMREHAAEGRGLTRPTLSVLLAHAKLYAKSQLLDSGLPEDAATDGYLVEYFPRQAVEAAGPERLRQHRLRREIVTTELVNDLVNLMGASFLHRVSRDSGRPIADVVRAWLVASRIAGAPDIRRDLQGVEGTRFSSEVVYRWLAGLARVLEATTHWLLANVAQGAGTDALIEEARTGLAALRGGFARVVTGEDRSMFLARLGELQDLGVDRVLAERLITLRFLPQLLEIVHVARAAGTEELRTARAYYAVSEKLATARLRDALRDAAGNDPWNRRYAQALSEDVAQAQRRLVADVLAHAGDEPARAVQALEKERGRVVKAYHDLLAELRGTDVPLAAYALAVRQLQEVAGAR